MAVTVSRGVVRRWTRRSAGLSRRCLVLVACGSCLVAYLALYGTLVISNPATDKTLMQTLAKSGRAVAAVDRDARKLNVTQNRTVLPDDCFHDLLRSVDPTCELGLFCTESWRQEDVLCRVFLHQAAFRPGPGPGPGPGNDFCRLPSSHQHHTSETTGDEGEVKDDGYVHDFWRDVQVKVKDVLGVNQVKFKDVLGDNQFKVRNVVGDNPVREDNQVKVKDARADEQDVQTKDVVPRLAYYVLMSESCSQPVVFRFLHYLSVLSVQRYLRPRAIYVLGNCVPFGYWWSRVVDDVRALRFVRRSRPRITADGQVKWIAHLSDVIRLQVLLVNGGVYVDTDMILVRSLDPLLRYPLTMGLVDNVTGMGNALILATRGSVFIRDWYSGYSHFRPDNFHYNGMWEALRLWKQDPGSVHLESRRFYSPNWYEAHFLFDSAGYDLSHSYAVHVWHRDHPVPDSPDQILSLNTTLGHLFRHIYFGR